MRREIALAMLGDVVEVALTIGEVRVVTDDAAGRLVAGDLGARLIDDPGGGQGPAVGAGLEGADGLCLVVNADLPRVRPSDLNALGLPRADVFAPLYGPDSAEQFRAHAAALGIEHEELALPNLADDVDTV